MVNMYDIFILEVCQSGVQLVIIENIIVIRLTWIIISYLIFKFENSILYTTDFSTSSVDKANFPDAL